MLLRCSWEKMTFPIQAEYSSLFFSFLSVCSFLAKSKGRTGRKRNIGVKGNRGFLQEGHPKICHFFFTWMQTMSNSWLFLPLDKERESHNVGDSIEMLKHHPGGSIHQGSGAPFGIKNCFKPISLIWGLNSSHSWLWLLRAC